MSRQNELKIAKAKLEKVREYANDLIINHPTRASILAKQGENLLAILGVGKPITRNPKI